MGFQDFGAKIVKFLISCTGRGFIVLLLSVNKCKVVS